LNAHSKNGLFGNKEAVFSLARRRDLCPVDATLPLAAWLLFQACKSSTKTLPTIFSNKAACA
jgi:hypothetical protein